MPTEYWTPPEELQDEEKYWETVKNPKMKFYKFLRKERNRLFDREFQDTLNQIRAPRSRGIPPKLTAQMAMLLILQAHDGVSDDEALLKTAVDIRYQIVLDRLHETTPLCSKSTWVTFRRKVIEHNLDQALLRRTIDRARQSQLFGENSLKKLELAVDTAPMEGAGKVLDTINLLGSALMMLVTIVASMQGLTSEQVIEDAQLHLLKKKV